MRHLAAPLALLALSACNGNTDCPVDYIEDPANEGICCPDLDGDGACDEDEACPEGYINDPVDGTCCPDADADGTCDVVITYQNPAFISSLAIFGWDYNTSAADSTLRAYSFTSGGQSGSQNPALVLYLMEGTATAVGDTICNIYIEVDATTAIANTTSVASTDVGIGMVFNTADTGVTVSDGGAVGLTSCFDGANSKLDPAVWGSDPAAAVKAAGVDLGFVVTGPLTSASDLYTPLSNSIGADWATLWAPNVMEGTSYIGGTLTQGLFTQGGSPTYVGFGRSYVVDGSFDAGDLASASFVAQGDALTTDGAYTMQTAAMPFTNSDASALVGTPSR